MKLPELSEIQFLFHAALAWPCLVLPSPLLCLLKGGRQKKLHLKYLNNGEFKV